MLKDEEIDNIITAHPSDDYRAIFDLCKDIERAVLAKAMPIPKQEPANNRYCGHESLADMISTHTHVWRDLLEAEAARNNRERPYLDHELNALSDIEGAIKFEMDNPFHPQPAQAAAIPEPINTAPEDGEFLALSNDGEWLKVHNQVDVFKTGKRIVCHGKSGKFWAATHWMPLCK